ncbi:MAG TPA: thioether cross-link-forming SCIFF peptide maturase [Clostridiales bacterium]|nr:thioether cross-link-forming SCIFF peptide maturase [Clostridiales bacterium]
MPASLPPRVHRFELHGVRLAFDAGSGTLLELDEAAWRVLGDYLKRGFEPAALASSPPLPGEPGNGREDAVAEEARQEAGRLRESGALFSATPLTPRLEPVLKALCLHVAHRCQMTCAYCFASGGDYGEVAGSGLMTPATARAAIDFLLGSSPDVRRWAVDFFGGEPLLNWPVVKETIHYAERRAATVGGRVHFTLTTNGLALSPARLAFLDRHAVGLIISVDGRPAVHDALRRTASGRPTWSRAVKAARLAASTRPAGEGGRATGPTPWVRGTFTRRNLDFAQDALFLFRLGFPQVSLEPVCGGPPELALRPEDVPALAGQYELLAGECAANGFRFYHFELDLSGGPCVSRRIAACGAGSEYLTVTPEGDLYACHQLVGHDGFRVGDVRHGITRPEAGRRFLEGGVASGQCSECWARFLCGGGCRAAAFFEHGEVGIPPSLECALQKKRWECALWLAARRQR